MLEQWFLTVSLLATPLAGAAPVVGDAAMHRRQTSVAHVQVEGRIEDIAKLPPPQDDLLEVFIRHGNDTLTMAVVPRTWGASFKVGDQVTFAARPDGTQTYTALDGIRRTVPRVHAVEAATEVTATGMDDVSLMLGLLVLLMAAFGILAMVVARTRSARVGGFNSDTDEFDSVAIVEGQESSIDVLPEDPADAMAELARRSAESGA
jgi:hypothetical protein